MDTPPNTHPIGIDHAETWAETTPVPAIERRRTTPDPDAFAPVRRLSAQPDVDLGGETPPDTQPINAPPPDTQPNAASAFPAVVSALATPGPDGQAPLGKLAGLAGGPLAIALGVIVWLYFQGQEQTKTVVGDAMTRQAAEAKLEREREKIEEERRASAHEAAHTKLHDQERRELDGRLDKLLQVVERQEAKLDDLSTKVGELQPKRR